MTLRLVSMTPAQSRNAHQWRAIAYFLAGFETLATLRALPAAKTAAAAHGKRSAGAAAAGLEAAGFQALPDGNHGDNRRSIK